MMQPFRSPTLRMSRPKPPSRGRGVHPLSERTTRMLLSSLLNRAARGEVAAMESLVRLANEQRERERERKAAQATSSLSETAHGELV